MEAESTVDRRLGDARRAASSPAGRADVALSELYNARPAKELVSRHASLPYPYHCVFGDAQLVIDEDVFCPTLTHASPLLLESIDFHSGERVLDMFTGSGAFGINVALQGARRVVMVDVFPGAVSCVKKNAVLNGVEDVVDARLGTMSGCLQPGEQFDLVLANPPLLPGDPSDPLTAAVLDPGFEATLDFIRRLRRHLAANGRCYLLTSSVFERAGFDVDQLCRQVGLEALLVSKLDVGYETYRVHKIVQLAADVVRRSDLRA